MPFFRCPVFALAIDLMLCVVIAQVVVASLVVVGEVVVIFIVTVALTVGEEWI